MWQAIVGFIGGPVIKGLLDAYNAKLKAGNTSEKIAADAAAGEMAVQTVELREQGATKRAQIGHPLEPEKLFAYILVIYFAKLVLFDKVIGSFAGYTENIFRTDPLTGEALVWAGLIMSFYLGKRGFENVARILRK